MNMNDLKNSKAPVSTTTLNKNEFDAPTDNIYEAISIASKRAIQINSDIKKELLEKLEEFATYSDSLEEVFENKEQIEVSKFYEKLPKPHALAVEEWLTDKIYYRNTDPFRNYWRNSRLQNYFSSSFTYKSWCQCQNYFDR